MLLWVFLQSDIPPLPGDRAGILPLGIHAMDPPWCGAAVSRPTSKETHAGLPRARVRCLRRHIMAKNLVFCADGTWNGPEEHTGTSIADADDTAGELTGDTVTNVVKFYANLAGRPTPDTLMLRNEQEKLLPDATGSPLQVAKYVHGVGDARNGVMQVLGGVFGVGVIARIVRGYTFLSRFYHPGDAIYLLGFSRGAYTARALAGMIARVGLLNPQRYDVNDKEEAYQRGVAAWHQSKGLTLTGHAPVTSLANRFLDFVESFVARGALSPQDLIANVPI